MTDKPLDKPQATPAAVLEFEQRLDAMTRNLSNLTNEVVRLEVARLKAFETAEDVRRNLRDRAYNQPEDFQKRNPRKLLARHLDTLVLSHDDITTMLETYLLGLEAGENAGQEGDQRQAAEAPPPREERRHEALDKLIDLVGTDPVTDEGEEDRRHTNEVLARVWALPESPTDVTPQEPAAPDAEQSPPEGQSSADENAAEAGPETAVEPEEGAEESAGPEPEPPASLLQPLVLNAQVQLGQGSGGEDRPVILPSLKVRYEPGYFRLYRPRPSVRSRPMFETLLPPGLVMKTPLQQGMTLTGYLPSLFRVPNPMGGHAPMY